MSSYEQARMVCEVAQQEARAEACRSRVIAAARLQRRAVRRAERAQRASRLADRAAARARLAWTQLT